DRAHPERAAERRATGCRRAFGDAGRRELRRAARTRRPEDGRPCRAQGREDPILMRPDPRPRTARRGEPPARSLAFALSVSLSLSLALPLAVAPSTALAQSPAEIQIARQTAGEGLTAYKAADYTKAVSLF